MIRTFREQPALRDFRNFLYLALQFKLRCEPTPVQYDMGHFLQHGPERRMLKGYRGVGKSLLASLYSVWRWCLNPDLKILVVSAGKDRADAFSVFTRHLLEEWPLVHELCPDEDALRDSRVAFDVKGASAAHAPSMKSVGLTGQMTGSRADIIIADDMESKSNSDTAGKREKISRLSREFSDVLSPDGEIIVLGTDQTEESVYRELGARGYEVQIWPARYPDPELLQAYDGGLAPMIAEAVQADPDLVGRPVDPGRFTDEDLLKREADKGRSSFRLQFMLDPRLSDAERHPLRCSDLVVMECPREVLPEKIAYASGPEQEIRDLECVGFSGDRFFRPMKTVGDMVAAQGTLVAVDPSGRGSDETVACAVSCLNGWLYLHEMKGWREGYADGTMEGIADMVDRYKAHTVWVESNFGDGMFERLLTPFLVERHPAKIEGFWNSKQKERRIIDTLEPVMNQHKLVVDPQVVRWDRASTDYLPEEERLAYQLFYQLTHLTKDRGALKHDDRLDCLSIAVAAWVEWMDQNADKQRASRQAQAQQKALREFMALCKPGSPAAQESTWGGHFDRR